MNKKVLIVDDEEEVVAFVARFLKRMNIDSVTSLSGEDALECCSKENFDCILLDIHLGGISGIDVLKKLIEKDKNIKVIVITGSISDDNRTKVLDIGAVDFLQKPVELSNLKEKILKYI